MVFRSFRSRLLVGSLFATAGLVAGAHLMALIMIHRFPIVLRIGHGTLFVVAFACIVVGLSQVRRGLSPFDRLRGHLAAVRDGSEARIVGSYPNEVQPLVSDLNSLLEHREQMVRRGTTMAGDLAHGLKTPLAVLTQEAERATAAGQRELAETILQQVERMRRQIEYHLARARAAPLSTAVGVRTAVQPSAESLVRTLQRLHAHRGLAIEERVSAEHAVRAAREDLDEMLGNLLDNACKWAKSRVSVESSSGHHTIVLCVDDDGAGISPEMREMVLRRGVRADEAAPGWGLGLAIVSDLAELYGGSVSLEGSPMGGLRARLALP
ncbi:MAG: ATP-binding protein, partial [Acidobacteriota bacterium]